MLYGFFSLPSWGYRSDRMPRITRLPVVPHLGFPAHRYMTDVQPSGVEYNSARSHRPSRASLMADFVQRNAGSSTMPYVVA